MLHALHDGLRERDPEAVERFFAPEFESHNMPPGLPPGVDGVKAFFAMLRDAFPDIEIRVDDLVVDGDRAATATTMTGTHTGELLGIAPTGRRVKFTGLDLVRVDGDGRIAEHRGLTDTVGLLRQLS